MTEFIVHCPNPKCGLIYKPDSRIYKDADHYCPKCGADVTKPPPIFDRGRGDQEG